MFEFEVNWETPFEIIFSIWNDDTFEISSITLFGKKLSKEQQAAYIKEHGGMIEIEQECRDYADGDHDWRY